MNLWTFIVLTVAIGCGTGIVMEYLRTKRETAAKGSEAVAAETLAQLDALEKRIRVLERIVTENKFDLKREIDSL